MPRTASRIGSGRPGRCRVDGCARCSDRRGRFHRIRIDWRHSSGPGVSTDVESISIQPSGRCLADERSAAQVVDLVDALARCEPVGDLADLPLGVPEDEQVGLRIHQYGAPDLFGPVVEVRDAAQRRFDAADHDGHILVGLAGTLRIHDHAAVGARAGDAVRRIGVVAADPAIRGVAIHHRIHVAAGDAEEQVRPAEAHEVAGGMPVGLGDDPDAEALRLEHAADDGHAEARVVHVGVAGDDDDVAGIPAELVHLRPRHGQERRRAEPVGPVLAVRKQVAGGVHGAQFRPRRCADWLQSLLDQCVRGRYARRSTVRSTAGSLLDW